ncbi:hypothetical protein K3495_g7410 [Podosphaera aphanis]|nr:hypothetical protein K3495_g7410 [Podosphaera aphanis]
MSSNVGLSTPRGSGTSGYVQRNLAYINPRDRSKPYSKDIESLRHRQRQPDKDILEHERKRQIEVKIFELRDELEEKGVDEDEIEAQTTALKRKLMTESDKTKGGRDGRGLKIYDVHGQAEAKIKQQDRFRSALGIRRDYEEGSHWRRQEERAKLAQQKNIP